MDKKKNGSSDVFAEHLDRHPVYDALTSEYSSVPDYSASLTELQQEVDSKFTPKKDKSEWLSQIYDYIGMIGLGKEYTRKASRVFECATYLEFYADENNHKLHRANFCKDRLCPMCTARRSLKIYGQATSCLDYVVKENPGIKFLFVTFTVKNCSAEELGKTLDTILSSWKHLYHKNRRFMKEVQGSFRTLEITYNRNTKTFHPHLHCILAVKSTYFKSGHYIPQNEWAEMWQDATGVDYLPVVDVRKVKEDNERCLLDVVREVAKYTVKDEDYLYAKDMSEMVDVVYPLAENLYRRRLCGYTGCFRDAFQALKLDDAVDGDLVNVGDSNEVLVHPQIVRLHWMSGIYVRTE